MLSLHTLRNTPWLTRLALLWFALALGAAVASPMVNPQQELMICTGAGMLKVVLADDGTAATAAASGTDGVLFCPMCLLVGAPALVTHVTIEPPHPLSHVLQSIPAGSIPTLTAAPPPARAPPSA